MIAIPARVRIIYVATILSLMKLEGHSGCCIEILQGADGPFVRKHSSNVDYNQRLIKQCEKQRTLNMGTIASAPVLAGGYSNDIFYFDMVYISGMTFAKYLRTIELSKISEYAKILTEHIHNNGNFDLDAKKVFLSKTKTVIDNISTMDVYKNNSSFRELIDQCKSVLKHYEWNHIVPSPCHGDYTLENLIISKEGRVYAIDMLDSFYDTWQIDVAKLLQDVELGWSYRNAPGDDNLRIRQIIMKECILERVRDLRDGDNLIISIYYILLLNVLRIIPYTHDDMTMEFLSTKLIILCKKIKLM